jgi:predicted N-acyltransferase
MQQWQWSIVNSLSEIPTKERENLQQTPETATPFLSVKFLDLLATSGSVDGDSGWVSHHILIQNKEDGSTVALVPCYLKTHSYGEYIFDHAWANAYHQHGLAYYPKLLCAVPFTPVTGSRALIHVNCMQQGISETAIFEYIASQKESLVEHADASSLHILFQTPAISERLTQQNMHQRLSVQFIWSNQDYSSFDDFMNQLTSRKRRSIRKERAPFTGSKSNQAPDSIEIKTLYAEQLSQEHLDAFYLCYQQTYFKRSGHAGYLTAAFFDNLIETLRPHICIIGAFRNNAMIAGSLFFYNDNALFGRYWGALEDVSGLHFECCYYRGIDFAIQQGIALFNPGTQGEHKILRGFCPTYCYSNHFLLEPAFDQAVADFVRRERPSIEQYHAQASQVLPYKKTE